jgi:high-affinity nickel-transport protein
VYYNLAITGVSVAICFFIGGVEVLGLFPQEINGLSRHGFWGFVGSFNINTAGFVIVGMLILTWLAALLVWRYGQIEEKWTRACSRGWFTLAAQPGARSRRSASSTIRPSGPRT